MGEEEVGEERVGEEEMEVVREEDETAEAVEL